MNNDIIKTFLKLEQKKQSNNSLYSLDSLQNIFSLYSPEKNKQDFELDKIFTNSDENSYIYEIICLNTIKECIKGTSYSFISFGETINNKLEFLIGDLINNYKNINYYGLFIRFLQNLLIEKNEKEIDYSIKFSNFLVFENNLIDLTYFGNKKKGDYGIDTNLFLSNAYKIKNDSNIINNMNKISINNINETIKYLRCILDFLYKLEKKIYSRSNICFIIYLINEQLNKTISTVSFVSLCGSEHLYANDIQNSIDKTYANEKRLMEATKSSIETRFTFESVINCVANNNFIRNKIAEKNHNIIKEKNNEKTIDEKKELSKLTIVLYDICFGKDIFNIKYRFIGNIRPIEGYYTSVRDVLLFLFDCSKIMKKIVNSKKNSIVEKSPRDELIFNLEYKIKMQSKTINDLNNSLESQNKKIIFLEKSYREQINTIKKYFNFKGDINILLSGDENSKEMKYVEKIKNHNLLVIKYESTIDNLEKKLASAENDIKRLKNKLNSKELDQTMINYYLSVKNCQDQKINYTNSEILKELYDKIDKLNKEINNKNKIIDELKRDLDKKNDIFCKFSKTLTSQMESWAQSDPKEIAKKMDKRNKNNKKDLNDSELSDNTLKQELVKIKIKEQKSIEELKEKYNYILLEKKNTIYELEHKFEKIDEFYKYEFKKTNSELTKIYGMLISLISYIENNRKIILIEKNSTELEKIIFSIKDDINNINFPFLFKEIDNQKRLKEKKEKSEENKGEENSTQSEKNKVSKKEENIIKNNEYEDLSKDEIIERLNNKIKRLMSNYEIQLKKYNNNVFLMGLQQRTIEKLKREINLYKQTFRNKNITPPIISLNTNINNDGIKNENKMNQAKKAIQKSFSFNNKDKAIFNIPLLSNNNKFKETDSNNIDSIRAASTNNTNNYNSFFRPSSPDSSYSITNSNNINTSILNKNNSNNINKVLFLQKKSINEQKNRRPFSSIRQRNNFNFNRKNSKAKY